jgi:DSF synthase
MPRIPITAASELLHAGSDVVDARQAFRPASRQHAVAPHAQTDHVTLPAPPTEPGRERISGAPALDTVVARHADWPGSETDFAMGISDGAKRLAALLTELDLREIELEYDPELGAVWGFQRHLDRPSYTRRLLADMAAIQRTLRHFHETWPNQAASAARFTVLASRVPGIFNLGGDLQYFTACVEAGDRAALRDYAMACIDVVYQNYAALGAPVISAALVAGDALGGGFEAALACDLIVAEEGARFGLPEIHYGLFPGMGAYTFLSRRIGQAAAERMILDGALMSADDLERHGLIARVASAGQGLREMDAYLARTAARFGAAYSIFSARRRSQPIDHEEMIALGELWVGVAMSLSERQLRMMRKLVNAQRLRAARRDV